MKSKQRNIYFLLFILLFIGTNVWYSLGFPLYHSNSSILFRINPVIYCVIILFVYNILSTPPLNFSLWIKKKRLEFRFLILLIIVIIYTIYQGQGGIVILLTIFLLPVLITIQLEDSFDKRKLRRLIMFFFVINSLIAIFERLISSHLFELDPVIFINDRCYNPFRSIGLQNHALNNALLTDIILLFILTSNQSIKLRYSSALLGFIAILCFGARSSLLLWVILFPLLLLREWVIAKKKKKNIFVSIGLLLIFLILAGLLYYLLTSTMFGERIMAHNEFDRSAEIRLDSLGGLEYLSTSELWWGSSLNYQLLKNDLGINAIENFYIIWILRFGLFFSLFLIYYSFSLIMKYTKKYPCFEKYFLFFSFLLVASTNNSLATDSIAITLYLICAFSFEPLFIKNDT